MLKVCIIDKYSLGKNRHNGWQLDRPVEVLFTATRIQLIHTESVLFLLLIVNMYVWALCTSVGLRTGHVADTYSIVGEKVLCCRGSESEKGQQDCVILRWKHTSFPIGIVEPAIFFH